jgi:histidine triad (HIT) family protein
MTEKKNCIFCQIIEGKLPSQKVHDSERVMAFRDISPQAPTHVLVVPKAHINDVSSVSATHGPVFQELLVIAQELAKKWGLDKSGFRTVFNSGEHGCQTVFHLHLHLLGGAQMGGSMVG